MFKNQIQCQHFFKPKKKKEKKKTPLFFSLLKEKAHLEFDEINLSVAEFSCWGGIYVDGKKVYIYKF